MLPSWPPTAGPPTSTATISSGGCWRSTWKEQARTPPPAEGSGVDRSERLTRGTLRSPLWWLDERDASEFGLRLQVDVARHEHNGASRSFPLQFEDGREDAVIGHGWIETTRQAIKHGLDGSNEQSNSVDTLDPVEKAASLA